MRLKIAEIFCLYEYYSYLCIGQLVILIYIYHFPSRNPSVKIGSFFLLNYQNCFTDSTKQQNLFLPLQYIHQVRQDKHILK